MEVKDRLTQFLSYKKIGQVSFASIAGLSRGYVNNIVNSIGPVAQSKIAKSFPELNIGWLLTGKGNMLKDQPVSTDLMVLEHEFPPPYKIKAKYAEN